MLDKRSRYIKKIISLFLAVLMLAGSCTVFAASNEDASAQVQDFPQAGFRYVSPWPDLEGGARVVSGFVLSGAAGPLSDFLQQRIGGRNDRCGAG